MTAPVIELCVAESIDAPPAAPGLTLRRCVDLTGLRWGAAYTLGSGRPVLEESIGAVNIRAADDFFARPELLASALGRAEGRIVRLRNAAADQPAARSVLARAGLSLMLLVPRAGDTIDGTRRPEGVLVLGAPRVGARWHLGHPGHTQRVSRYCRVLGLLSGLSDRESELLGQAAALHDVGKLAVPSEILLKPGPLTAGERVTVERHAGDGQRILSGSPHSLSDLAAVIAGTHHERWDGSGYPLRLSGRDIPLAGRIAAIADVYDALTSDRPYRPALNPLDAVQRMAEGAGSAFDPHLLRLFLQAMPRLSRLSERLLARATVVPSVAPPIPAAVC